MDYALTMPSLWRLSSAAHRSQATTALAYGVRRAHGWAETYLHPKDSGGVLFQFYTEEEHEHPHEGPK